MVPRGHQTHGLKIGCKDVSVFVNGAVLRHFLSAGFQCVKLRKPGGQKVHIQVECPTLHVLVEVVQVGVVIHALIVRRDLVVLGEKPCEGGFTRADVACNREVHIREKLGAQGSGSCAHLQCGGLGICVLHHAVGLLNLSQPLVSHGKARDLVLTAEFSLTSQHPFKSALWIPV